MDKNFLQNIPWWHRLRGKLFLIIAFLLAFGLILSGLVTIEIYKKELRDHAKDCNMQLGNKAYHIIKAPLKTISKHLSFISKNFDITDGDTASIKLQLQEALDQLYNVGLLVLFDTEGEEIASAVKNKDIFLKRRDQERSQKINLPPLNHNPVYTASTLYSIIDIFLPITGESDKNIAILRVSVSLDKIWNNTHDIKVKKEQKFYIVNDEGFLIAHSELGIPISRMDFGHIKKVNEFIMHSTKTRAEKALIYKNFDGIDVLGTLTLYPDLNWGIIVELPVTSVFQSSQLFLKKVSLIIGLIFIATFLLGLFLIKIITHPYDQAYKDAYNLPQGFNMQQVFRIRNEANRIEQLFNLYKKTIQEKNLILSQQTKNITLLEKRLKDTDEENARIAQKFEVSQRFIKDFIKGINVLILRLDLEGKVYLYNKKCQDVIGYTKQRMLGANWFSLVYSKEEGQQALKDFNSCFRNGSSLSNYTEEKILSGNGEIKIIGWHNVKLYDKEKDVTSILRIGEDITQKKKLLRELQEENEELKKNNAELENIISIVSHDLKTPLYILQDFASILLEDYKKSLGEEVRYYLERIKVNATYMEKLILDLLELTRISGVEKAKQIQPVSQIIESVLVELQNQIREKHIKVIVAKDFPSVYCDATDILRVFMNLISNAIKFTQNDSTESLIEIGYAERNDCYEFFVKDNGIGIQKEFHGKIFVIFQRLQDKQNLEGTGVGLTIVKKIVEEHGGVVWVDSAEGKGSTFYFTLPKMKSNQDIYNIENSPWTDAI
ncbi:MAG: ATP-binding protein [bacterium]